MANLCDWHIYNVTPTTKIAANKLSATFSFTFTDHAVTYPDGSVGDWPYAAEGQLATNIDVSGANAAAKKASADAWLRNYARAVLIPRIRADRDAEWTRVASPAAVMLDIVVTNDLV